MKFQNQLLAAAKDWPRLRMFWSKISLLVFQGVPLHEGV
jgi:hypothetical protein